MTSEKNLVLNRRISGIKVWPYVFCAPFVLSYLAFNLFPTVYSFYISLFDWNGISPKVFTGFDNYIRLWTKDPLFFKSILNTFTIMLMSIPFQITFGLLLAHFVFNLRKGKQFYQTVTFMPYITAPVAIGFIFSYIYDWQHGYINTILINLGIINEGIYWLQTPGLAKFVVANMIVWRMTGYCMIIYMAGMTSIPIEIYEAATVDGASKIQTFFRITLPQLKNITTFLVVTAIINGLQMFDEAVMLYAGSGLSNQYVGGPENSVLTIIWKFYDDTFKSNMMLGYGASISYSLFIIIVILSIISYRVTNGKGND